MLKRSISGAVYVALITGFFLIRELTPYPELFHILIWFMGAMGTFEVARAVKDYSVKGALWCAVVFGILFSPVYFVFEHYIFNGWGWLVAIDFTLLFVLAFAVYCIIKNRSANEYVVSILPFVYPALLLLTMHLTTDIVGQAGFIATLLIFVVSPLTDTFAYLVGMTYNKIRKGKAKKLCPKLSPKKTVAGAIGGLVGGVLAGFLVWVIFRPELSFFSPVLLLIIAGLFGGILTQIGDLFESFIKRKVGLKDMGKIMPGHGGVMDRIDGMIFASLLICVIFLIV